MSDVERISGAAYPCAVSDLDVVVREAGGQARVLQPAPGRSPNPLSKPGKPAPVAQAGPGRSDHVPPGGSVFGASRAHWGDPQRGLRAWGMNLADRGCILLPADSLAPQDLEKALRLLRSQLERAELFPELKKRQFAMSKGEKRRMKRAESRRRERRRAQKAARWRAKYGLDQDDKP